MLNLSVKDDIIQVVLNGADALRDELEEDRDLSLYVMGQYLKMLRGTLKP